MKQKATITITESDDGGIKLNIDFDPPAKTKEKTNQVIYAAMKMVQSLKADLEDAE